MGGLTVMRWECECGKQLKKTEVQQHKVNLDHWVPSKGSIIELREPLNVEDTLEIILPVKQPLERKYDDLRAFTGDVEKDYPETSRMLRALRRLLTYEKECGILS